MQVRDLRSRVRASEQDAAAARVLAGGADRDVGEIRGDIRNFQQAAIGRFNALREDMVDMRQEMVEGFSEMRSKFDTAAAGQQRIVELIETVIDAQGGSAAE
ncbi:hypothetical protein PP713_03205 [Mycobacterium sp. CSUR Q5927]|nr:hypothetical protein [Mycobacterium sp. CSUR Q5927]